MNWMEQVERARKLRRKYVKRYGKRALRRLDHYLARQSLIVLTLTGLLAEMGKRATEWSAGDLNQPRERPI